MSAATPELFAHVRIIIGMVMGLGITRLLSGAAGFIQHPSHQRVSLLHSLWAVAVLLELILFWWWDVRSIQDNYLNFRVYIAQITYAITLYMLAALLFPENIAEFDGYEDFFINRRRWFFSFLAVTWAIDILKISDPLSRINSAFAMQAGISLSLCLIAILFKQRYLQLAVVVIYIGRQIYSIFP